MRSEKEANPASKAEAIRLANLQSPNLSNAQLKNFVRKKWNMHIESNQIAEVLGSEGKRRNHKLEALKLKLAESFIQKIGDYKEAIRLLRLAGKKA